MRTSFIFILCVLSLGNLRAQEPDTLIGTIPPSANELLEECTESEHILLEEQLSEKNIFESNKQSTRELFNLELEQLKLFSITVDPTESLVVDPTETAAGAVMARKIIVDPKEQDPAEIRQRTITGPSQYDSRIEVNELSPLIAWQRKILDNSQSVGIIIERDRLSDLTDSIYALDISTKLKSVFNLCPEEPYGDQLSLGVGTAFITGEDVMMTAGHVLEADIEDYVILFNFEVVNRGGAIFPIVAQSNVFEIQEIITEDSDLDITEFRVNKPLKSPPLKLATGSDLAKGESIYMIGHPSGLPKKVALNASVYTNDETFHFYTTLDAFQGNSGSPVFDMETHTVIGVLVSGSQDYEWTGNCNKSSLCYIPYCKGEKVMRMEQILNN